MKFTKTTLAVAMVASLLSVGAMAKKKAKVAADGQTVAANTAHAGKKHGKKAAEAAPAVVTPANAAPEAPAANK